MTQTPQYSRRLEKVRNLMKQNSLSALIVGSKDEFLNEYVNKDLSSRIYLTGFDGTAGELLITNDKAYLLVDGRYHTQADNQVDKELFTIEKVGINEDGTRNNELIPERLVKLIQQIAEGKNLVIGYDPTQLSVKMLDYIRDETKKVSRTSVFTPLFKSLAEEIIEEKTTGQEYSVFYVHEEISGASCTEKIKRFRQRMHMMNLNAFFVSKPDELAYITNLRGNEIDYNSTFKGYAFISSTDAYLFTDVGALGCLNLRNLNEAFEVVPLKNMEETLNAYIERQSGRFHIGYDPACISCATLDKLNRLINRYCKLLEIEDNPIKNMKAIKNETELDYMKKCFTRADNVFNDVIEWVNKSVSAGLLTSEYDLREKVIETFRKYGANRLSFEPICAVGKNSAVIHYTQSDKHRYIKPGDTVLIDSGGYFEGGYTTDLTRTFIAGDKKTTPHPRLKRIYTKVLKAALKGLMAEVPPEADGTFLDSLVRQEVVRGDYDYNHGTGHGIGILVHESPPTISYSNIASVKLRENMVFSIEPGIYIEGWGGVRIENIATLKKHHNKYKAQEGWLEVVCLTYAPLDENLIDYALIEDFEQEYLKTFKKSFRVVEP